MAPAHVKCEVEGRRLINFIVSDVFNNARYYTPHKLHMAFVLGYEESAREGRVSNLYSEWLDERPAECWVNGWLDCWLNGRLDCWLNGQLDG